MKYVCCGKTYEVEEKQGCVICGKPIIYDVSGKARTCAICGKRVWSHEECENGHYVCDKCHQNPAAGLIELLKATQEKSPSVLMEELWKLPEVHLFGPEHHWLVPCVLLTAYRNNVDALSFFDKAMQTAYERGSTVVGGSCGYWGACGAAIGVGIFFSIMLESTPLNTDVWSIPQKITAECLTKIADSYGPRCCKRTCRSVIDTAAKYIDELFGVRLDFKWSDCSYSTLNNECMGTDCPYFHKEEK